MPRHYIESLVIALGSAYNKTNNKLVGQGLATPTATKASRSDYINA